MKITKRKYLDKKYLHDIDKWEEDTRNRVNTAASIASSGIGALSGATLSRNIKSKPGRAAERRAQEEAWRARKAEWRAEDEHEEKLRASREARMNGKYGVIYNI